MRSLPKTLVQSAAVIALCTSPGFADVTADQVWLKLREMMQLSVQDVAATLLRDGRSLTVSDIRLSGTKAAEVIEMVGTVGDIVLIEQGDGTVIFRMPETYDLDLSISVGDGDEFDMAIAVASQNVVVTASGDPDDMNFGVEGGSVRYKIDPFEIPEGDKTVSVSGGGIITGLSGSYSFRDGDVREIVSRLEGSGLELDYQISAEEFDVSLDLSMEAPKALSTVMMPELDGLTSLTQMVDAGLVADTTVTYSSMDATKTARDKGATNTFTATDAGGEMKVAVSPDGILYDMTGTGVTSIVSLGGVPVPEFSLEMARATVKMMLPVVRSSDPKPLEMVLSLEGVEASDTVWGMFDPTGVLSRAPASFTLDLSGEANLVKDIFAPTLGSVDLGTVAQLHKLTLNQLRLNIAGAALTGGGDFAFDMDDTESFDGFPRPEGEAEFQLTGGNALLQQLSQLGIVPEAQVMGLRMMIPLFARPGSGEDTLTTDVSIDAKGAVFVNGQRLK